MNIFTSGLQDFHIQIYQFYLKFKEEVNINPRFHFALRGAFGYQLRKMVCITKQKNCKDCILKQNCVYKIIFESEPHKRNFFLDKYSSIPNPYIINKLSQIDKYNIKFNLVLFGRSIPYLPYFVYAYSKIGEGEGIYNVKYDLYKVKSFKSLGAYFSNSSTLIYNNKKLKNYRFTLSLNELQNLSLKEIKYIKFITPLRIKYSQKYIADIQFHHIIRSLLRRISILLNYHCDSNLDIEPKKLIKESEKVRIKSKELKWLDWMRYSKSQNQKMNLGGVVGKIEFSPDCFNEIFKILLYIGSIVNVGKQTSFGFGDYNINF